MTSPLGPILAEEELDELEEEIIDLFVPSEGIFLINTWLLRRSLDCGSTAEADVHVSDQTVSLQHHHVAFGIKGEVEMSDAQPVEFT